MLVDADRDVVRQRRAQRGDPAADVVGQERARRVDDEDALAAGVGDDPRLLRHARRIEQVGRVEVAVGRHAELAREAEVLHADVGLGADGRDAGDGRAGVVRDLEIGLGADAGEDRDRDLRPLGDARGAAASSSASECSGRPYWIELAPSPSPCPTAIAHTPARSSARATVSTWSTRYWCAIACEPSRSVVSTIRTPARCSRGGLGVQLRDAHRGGRS